MDRSEKIMTGKLIRRPLLAVKVRDKMPQFVGGTRGAIVMGTRDDRVGAYIAASAEFARPILNYLRDLVHATCPNVEETMKWNFPHFQYKGLLCSMAAFKAHCSFGFWKGSLILGKARKDDEKSAGEFGRITTLAELPSRKVLSGYIKKAMELNDAGVKPAGRPKPKTVAEVIVPDDLTSALQKNKTAMAAFEKFPPSHRREYIEWITDAKTEPTRTRRLQTAIEWIAEGKSRQWKYARR
jgi:uncharacterized protein YdeI (YjbR/CyaY-like superfamily)